MASQCQLSKREKIFCEDTNKLEHPNKIVVLLLDIEYPLYNKCLGLKKYQPLFAKESK